MRTKAWLSQHSVDFDAHDVATEPPSLDVLQRLVRVLPGGASDLHNPNKVDEPDYRREIAGRDLDDQALIAVYARFPELLQKPIVDGGDWAVAGYRPELLERQFAPAR